MGISWLASLSTQFLLPSPSLSVHIAVWALSTQLFTNSTSPSASWMAFHFIMSLLQYPAPSPSLLHTQDSAFLTLRSGLLPVSVTILF